MAPLASLQRLALGLAAILVTYGSAAQAVTCTKTAVAAAGDTCATLGTANNISVGDFLRANPGLAGCTLVAGGTYCVATDGSTATAVPTGGPTSTSSGSVQPTGTLVPSPDGSDGVCGGQYTCAGSVYGDCCSGNGYCGNTTDYCGDGCNPLFGRCGGGSSSCDPTTVTVGGATATVTVGGGTATVTSVVTQVSTVTQTVTVTATAPGPVPTPNPVFPGTVKNCECASKRLNLSGDADRSRGTKWYQIKSYNERCSTIAKNAGITTSQLQRWNPGVCPICLSAWTVCLLLSSSTAMMWRTRMVTMYASLSERECTQVAWERKGKSKREDDCTMHNQLRFYGW